jgi:hypothetical protein
MKTTIMNKTKNGALKSLAVAGFIGVCSVGVSQAAVPNGNFDDLNGATTPNPSTGHNGLAPQGWSVVQASPDWAAPGFDSIFAPTMPSSPAGGNWVIGYSASTIFETIGTSVAITGFDIGKTYELSFWQAHNSDDNGSYNADGAWDATLFGTTLTSPLLTDVGNNQVWSFVTLDFVANSTTSNLNLGVSTSTPGTGISIDGIAITVVPEPSSTALLGLGGLALMLRRRR